MLGTSKTTTPKTFFEELEEPRKSELLELDNLIRQVASGLDRFMVGDMVGYGKHHYRYASGREGDTAVIALSSQKNSISLYIYISDGKQYLAEKYKKDLPGASIGKSCIRFKKIADLDVKVLEKLLKEAVKETKRTSYVHDATDQIG